MIEQDTIRLLRECDAGIKMGVSAIDEVVDKAQDEALRTLLGKLLRLFPQAAVVGHRDLPGTAPKACPCFDVAQEGFSAI